MVMDARAQRCGPPARRYRGRLATCNAAQRRARRTRPREARLQQARHGAMSPHSTCAAPRQRCGRARPAAHAARRGSGGGAASARCAVQRRTARARAFAPTGKGRSPRCGSALSSAARRRRLGGSGAPLPMRSRLSALRRTPPAAQMAQKQRSRQQRRQRPDGGGTGRRRACAAALDPTQQQRCQPSHAPAASQARAPRPPR